jgi:hypothetical protein
VDKVALRDGRGFDCAIWMYKARELPKEQFKHEVQKHLPAKDTEPQKMLYFKVYKGQSAVIEQSLEPAALMLGGDEARGYCLEMIAADFLAGVAQETSNESMLLAALVRLINLLMPHQQKQLLQYLEESSASTGTQAAATKA